MENQKQLKNKTKILQIMPGSGINKTNILSFKEAGFEMVHFSALKNLPTETTNLRVSFSNGREGSSDKQTIAEIIALVAQHS